MNLNTNTIDISGNLYLQDAPTGDLSPLKEASTKKKGKGRPAADFGERDRSFR